MLYCLSWRAGERANERATSVIVAEPSARRRLVSWSPEEEGGDKRRQAKQSAATERRTRLRLVECVCVCLGQKEYYHATQIHCQEILSPSKQSKGGDNVCVCCRLTDSFLAPLRDRHTQVSLMQMMSALKPSATDRLLRTHYLLAQTKPTTTKRETANLHAQLRRARFTPVAPLTQLAKPKLHLQTQCCFFPARRPQVLLKQRRIVQLL